MSTHLITLSVNGACHQHEVEARTLLAYHLRVTLRVTSVHIGCDTTQCGACTVHLNGHAVKSCTVFAVQAHEGAVETVDGLGQAGELHPLQASFQAHHALQCGFCTPGMIMSSLELLRQHPDPSEAQVRAWLKGNFCRCTGYQHIVEAIRAAAPQLHTARTTTAPVDEEVLRG